MSKLKALNENRGEKLKKLNTLTTELEGTDLTAEERSAKNAEFNTLADDIDSLDTSIKNAERAAKLTLHVPTRSTDPNEPAEEEGETQPEGRKPGRRADGLTAEEREIVKSFSLRDAYQAAASRNYSKVDGFTAEMHQEAVKENQRCTGHAIEGIGVPEKALNALAKRSQLRAMSAGVSADGGYGVPTILGSWIDYLFDASWIDQFGVDIMGGLVGNFSMPKDGAATAAWATETGTLSDSTPTIGVLALTPKRLGAFIKVSKQLAIQSPELANSRVFQTIMKSIRQKLESSLVDSVSNGPTGIIDVTGIGDVAMGTNGLAPTFAKIVDLLKKVDVANALTGNLAFLSTPEMSAKLMTTQQFASTNGVPVNVGGNVLGYKFVGSNAVPKTLVKGSSSDCHAIIYGDWNQATIAQWGGWDMIYDPYTAAESGLDRVICNTFWDLGLKQPGAFAAILDARDV